MAIIVTIIVIVPSYGYILMLVVVVILLIDSFNLGVTIPADIVGTVMGYRFIGRA